MIELSRDISGEQLVVGLRPSERVERAAFAFVEALNVKATPFGLELVERPADPFSGGVALDYPFPQFFHLKAHDLLFGRTKLWEVDTNDWTISLAYVYDQNGFPLTQVTEGGIWHIAEGHDVFLAFNGSVVIYTEGLKRIGGISPLASEHPGEYYISPRSGAYYPSPRGTGGYVSPRSVSALGGDESAVTGPVQGPPFYVAETPIQSGCFFKGRFVFGSFGANPWEENVGLNSINKIFDTWISLNNTISSYIDVGDNWVMWSSIGGGDFPFWLFHPEASGIGPTAAKLLERAKENTFGFMPMSWRGPIRRIAQLGDAVMVYGAEGVSLLRPVNAGSVQTFGEWNFQIPGVSARGNVGVSSLSHIWLDRTGDLWEIRADAPSPRRLGYKEYLEELVNKDVSITWDDVDDMFFISSNITSFVFSNGVLTEVDRKRTSVWTFTGVKYALESEGLDHTIRLVTTPFDLGERTLKTITGVWLSLSVDADVYVAVDYRYDLGREFVRTDWYRVNPHGDVAIRAAGVDFRLAILISDDTQFNLDAVRIKWQASDRRFVRGPSTNSLAS